MARARVVITAASVPRFPRGTRFRFDAARDRWVILAPERVLMPDEIAVEVLKLVDGTRTVDVIITDLAARFAAPVEQVGADVITMLQDLADKAVMEDGANG